MRAFITGATGYLGTAMLEAVPANFDVVAAGYRRSTGSHTIDIRDPVSVAASIDRNRPDVIIHLAAISRIPEADADPERAMDVNATGSANVARVAAARSIRLIAMSTDNVFDGAAPPYTEDSPASPLGPYGRSKLAAERAILEAHSRSLILRTSLLVGSDRAARNPFSVFVLERAAAGQVVELYEREKRNFYPVTMAARAVWEAAVRPELAGLLHVGAVASATRYDFGRQLINAAGYDPDLAVPVTGPPGRPADLTLDVSRAQATFETRIPTIDEAIAETLRDMRVG